MCEAKAAEITALREKAKEYEADAYRMEVMGHFDQAEEFYRIAEKIRGRILKIRNGRRG